MRYDRKIKYLELMERDVSLQNAGFVKLEVRDAQISMQIKAERLKATDDGDVQVILLSGENKAVLGDLHLEQGRGSALFEAADSENLAGGIGYDDLQEIRIHMQDGRYLRCRIKEIVDEKRVEEEKPEVKASEKQLTEVEEPELEAVDRPMQQPELGAIVLAAEPAEEKAEPQLALQMPREEQKEFGQDIIRENPARTMASTKWQQLWNMYPHIRPFEDHREYLKLKPEDLVVLTSECYPLVSNSFLLHGFHNYQHLILTKELMHGQEKYYIGAPGNFYNKEKQVAILFGFESFEGKVEPAQSGDFGYYMIPVEI